MLLEIKWYKLEDKIQNVRKYAQNIHLMRELYTKHLKDHHNRIIKQTIQLK
jgi:hypothetical protein